MHVRRMYNFQHQLRNISSNQQLITSLNYERNPHTFAVIHQLLQSTRSKEVLERIQAVIS